MVNLFLGTKECFNPIGVFTPVAKWDFRKTLIDGVNFLALSVYHLSTSYIFYIFVRGAFQK